MCVCVHQRWQQSKSSCVRAEAAVLRALPAVSCTQVVLRLYSCPAEVLMGFDVDSCCVAFDGDRCAALCADCQWAAQDGRFLCVLSRIAPLVAAAGCLPRLARGARLCGARTWSTLAA